MTKYLERQIPEEDMTQFLREVGSIPRLTVQEERQLASRQWFQSRRRRRNR